MTQPIVPFATETTVVFLRRVLGELQATVDRCACGGTGVTRDRWGTRDCEPCANARDLLRRARRADAAGL